jgi:hypothetical protein
MAVTRHRIEIAARRAAEARRYIEEMRHRIARLRESNADTAVADAELQAIAPVVERFEAYVNSLHIASTRGNAAGA